jgi:hypothetical protein
MVNCCINPVCRTELQLLTGGDLYAIEKPPAEAEFLWMCAGCASRFNLSLDSAGNLALVPKGRSDPGPPPQLQARLHLVAHTRQHIPWRNEVPAGADPRNAGSGNWGTPAHGAHDSAFQRN